MTGINGAQANQAKKQIKNASHDIWKARIAGVEKLNSLMDVAFLADKSTDGKVTDIMASPELNIY